MLKQFILNKTFLTGCVALMATTGAFAAFDASYYVSNSALSQGHWVKVRVTAEGVHAISDQQLLDMGFQDPSKVAVYGFPAVELSDYRLVTDYPDDVPAVPVIRHNGRLLFYGVPDLKSQMVLSSVSSSNHNEFYAADTKRNYYADYGTYFLTDALPLLEMSTVPAPGDATPISTSFGMVRHEEEVQNKVEMGAPFLGTDFADQNYQVYDLYAPGYNAEGEIYSEIIYGMRAPQVNLPVSIPGWSGKLFSNNSPSATFAYRGLGWRCASDEVPVPEGNVFKASINATGLGVEYGGIDFVQLNYERHNEYTGNPGDRYVFTSLSVGQPIEITNAPEDVMVWDVTNVSAPRLFTLADNAESGKAVFGWENAYKLDAAGNCAYAVAFRPDDDNLLSVTYEGEVTNQNLHATEVPHMLIVAPSAFMQQANRIAALHRSIDGIDVNVVLVDDVYNEFSYGTPHIMGIRRLAKMYYDRAPEKFRSILLFGDGSFDNRGISFEDKDAFRSTHLPIYLREEMGYSGRHADSWITDAMVAMLDDTEGSFHPGSAELKVAVSRLPAHDQQDANTYVSKIEKYLTTPVTSDAYNRALFLAGPGDGNSHMFDVMGAEAEAIQNAPAITTYRGFQGIYPNTSGRPESLRQQITNLLAKGLSYVNYSGHGRPDLIGANLIDKHMSESYVNNVLPMFMLSTCRSVYFDHKGGSVGESLMLAPNGGAITLVGALREVYQESNLPFNVNMAHEFFSAPYNTTYGEIVRRAKNRTIPPKIENTPSKYYDVVFNSLSFNMLGDPELRPNIPSHTIEITDIDSYAIPPVAPATPGSEQPATIPALHSGEYTNVAGQILGPDGQLDTSFSGELILTAFDGIRTTKIVNYEVATDIIDVELDESQLGEWRLKVENGRFSGKIFLVQPDYMTSTHRLSLYAIADNGTQAVGYSRDFTIVEADNTFVPEESSAPVIRNFYIGSPDFANGDLVAGSITVYADITSSDIGLFSATSKLGKSLNLILDDTRTYTAAGSALALDADGNGRLEFPISGLSDGKHTLTLRVANFANQMTDRTISFQVVNSLANPELCIEDYPATTEATIALNHHFPEEPVGKLVIKNARGHVVHTAAIGGGANTFPYTWNLTDNQGNRVPEGFYLAEAYLQGGSRFGVASPVQIIVIREE